MVSGSSSQVVHHQSYCITHITCAPIFAVVGDRAPGTMWTRVAGGGRSMTDARHARGTRAPGPRTMLTSIPLGRRSLVFPHTRQVTSVHPSPGCAALRTVSGIRSSERRSFMALNIPPVNGAPRPASAPPQSTSESIHIRRPGEEDLRRRILSSSLVDGTELPNTPPLDLMPQLQRSGPSIVKTRTGSVLSRGFILKTDHYPSGMR